MQLICIGTAKCKKCVIDRFNLYLRAALDSIRNCANVNTILVLSLDGNFHLTSSQIVARQGYTVGEKNQPQSQKFTYK